MRWGTLSVGQRSRKREGTVAVRCPDDARTCAIVFAFYDQACFISHPCVIDTVPVTTEHRRAGQPSKRKSVIIWGVVYALQDERASG